MAQSVQAVTLELFENRPAAHGVHGVLPVELYDPAWQGHGPRLHACRRVTFTHCELAEPGDAD